MYCEEIRPYWLLVTRGYGFTVDDIDWSCPADLEPYAKAHKMEVVENDSIIHTVCGSYVLSAVSVAVEHCLAGRKAKSKYIDKPIMQEIEQKQDHKSNVPLTEEEKKKQTEQLFMKLRIMGANFNLNHKERDKNES